MSRIAKAPVTIPSGVDVQVEGNNVTVKGSKGLLMFNFDSSVSMEITDNVISMQWNKDDKPLLPFTVTLLPST